MISELKNEPSEIDRSFEKERIELVRMSDWTKELSIEGGSSFYSKHKQLY